MEAMDREFHERVRKGYLKMADIDARWVVVNANNEIDRVRADLMMEVTNRLRSIGLMEGERRWFERI